MFTRQVIAYSRDRLYKALETFNDVDATLVSAPQRPDNSLDLQREAAYYDVINSCNEFMSLLKLRKIEEQRLKEEQYLMDFGIFNDREDG